MTSEDDRQLNLFYKVERNFTKVLNTVVDKHEIAEITCEGLAILVKLKRFTSYYVKTDEAHAYVSFEKMGKIAGLSVSKVQKTVKLLIDKGYIEKLKVQGRRSNTYRITERYYAIAQRDNLTDKLVHAEFIPYLMKRREAELKVLERTGELPESSPMRIETINIQNLNVTINNNRDNAVSITANMDDIEMSALPKWLQASLFNRLQDKLKETSDEVSKEALKYIQPPTDQDED